MALGAVESLVVVDHDESRAASGGVAASRLGQVSWALFEWARNPHVLLITIYVFAPYFATHVVINPATGQADPVMGQAQLASLASIAGIFIAVLAPILGAIADLGGRRKPWIAVFAYLLAASVTSFWFVLPNGALMPYWTICTLLVLNGIFFAFTEVFHNSMLPDICTHKQVGGISGLGLALGNLSGLIMMLFMLWAFTLPGVVHWSFLPSQPLLGLDRANFEDSRIAGPITGIWLAVFALPLLLFTPDRPSAGLPIGTAVRQGVARVIRTLMTLLHYRNVALYLLARMIYTDGKTSILVFGGVYAAGRFHWGPLDMLAYGCILSVFAVFGGVFGGWLDNKLGSQKAILVSISGTAIGFVLSLLMGPQTILGIWNYAPDAIPKVYDGPFFNTLPQIIYIGIVIILAIFITAAYANSRTMLARIAPVEKMTEFFGLYSLSGTATSFMAPAVLAFVTAHFESQRAGMFSILAFLVVGLVLMLFVKQERAVTRV